MGWFDKLSTKLGNFTNKAEKVVDKIDEVSEKIEDVVEDVEQAVEVVDKVTKTAEELLEEKTNELSLANILIERLRGEILERVAEAEAKLDLVASPTYRSVNADEFKKAVKDASPKVAGKKPEKSEAIVTHYYENSLVVGMEVRWPQKKFYYLARREMPNLDQVKAEMLDLIRV